MSTNYVSKNDEWASLASHYKKTTTDVSNRPIARMLALADERLPFSQATHIHDNGCGTGAVFTHLLHRYSVSLPETCQLSCSDFSADMLSQVRALQSASPEDSLWHRVRLSQLDARDLSPEIASSTISHLTAGWVYFMTPSPRQCLVESLRVLQSEGVLTLSSWEGNQWMDLMGLAKKIDGSLVLPTLPAIWTDHEKLKREMEDVGFKQAHSERVPVEMTFETYEDLLALLMERMPIFGEFVEELHRGDEDAVERFDTARGEDAGPYCAVYPPWHGDCGCWKEVVDCDSGFLVEQQ